MWLFVCYLVINNIIDRVKNTNCMLALRLICHFMEEVFFVRMLLLASNLL